MCPQAARPGATALPSCAAHSLPRFQPRLVTWPHMPLLAGPHTHRPSLTGHLQLGDFLEGLVQRAVDVLELFFQLDAAEQAVSRRTAAAVMSGQRTCAAAIIQCASTASCRPLKEIASFLPPSAQAALCRIPRRRLSAAEARSGAGPLAVTSCAICLCDWRKGDDVRELKAS